MIDQESLDQQAVEFLKTPYGKYFFNHLALMHDSLFEKAKAQEDYRVAAKTVFEAKGLSHAIAELKNAQERIESGYYDMLRREEAEEIARDISMIEP